MYHLSQRGRKERDEKMGQTEPPSRLKKNHAPSMPGKKKKRKLQRIFTAAQKKNQ